MAGALETRRVVTADGATAGDADIHRVDPFSKWMLGAGDGNSKGGATVSPS